LGAGLSRGEYVLFLNNDTVALPGWYEPLLSDFTNYQNIAATGPLLLYPESKAFGHTIQHLGVFVSPSLRVGYLYKDIPADCALTKKRRFFQVITAACMMMRRSVFMRAGLFDEHYVNGFEDVDLCARLCNAGYLMTVNPEARVVHHEGQTPGRRQHEQANSQYIAEHSLSMLVPDRHTHLKNDGLELRLGPWQTMKASLPPEQCRRLDKIAAMISGDDLKELLTRNPFWENGWRSLIKKSEQKSDLMDLQLAFCKLHSSPEGAMDLYASACKAQDHKKISFAFNKLTLFSQSFEEYLAAASSMHSWCVDIGLDEMAKQYADWLSNAETFRTELYLPFLADFRQLVKQMPLSLHPHAR
jgi:GT2 family glycosyltransferase